MFLKELIKHISGIACPSHFIDQRISLISVDSREEQVGSLFVAMGGIHCKGADFIQEVIQKGAVAIALSVEDAQVLGDKIPENIILLKVNNTKQFLREVAQRYYDDPSRQLSTVGITGTNGKTTFTYLLEAIIHASGQSCGVMGTVNSRMGQLIYPTKNTTPGFIEIMRFLSLLKKQEVKWCVMEVSSHALHQGRVDGIDFSTAVFSNLTQDHLDYHKTIEEYFQAKALLFRNLKEGTPTIINSDDPFGLRIVAMTKGKVITYAIDHAADICALDVKNNLDQTSFIIKFPEEELNVTTSLIGKHNVYNILSAATCAYSLGFKLEDIRRGIESVQKVPGRVEAIVTHRDFHIFIDYAHTEDGLINVLKSIRAISQARIITVFGCGGDRDKTKRSKMGAVACALSDHAIITSDNPRSEDPNVIINQIIEGYSKKNYEVCVDRKQAIGKAIQMAQKDDVILLAGKGHENYQVLADQTIAFDEHDIVREFLNV